MPNNTIEERFDKDFSYLDDCIIGDSFYGGSAIEPCKDLKEFIKNEIHLAEQSLVQRVKDRIEKERQTWVKESIGEIAVRHVAKAIYDELSTPKPKGDK